MITILSSIKSRSWHGDYRRLINTAYTTGDTIIPVPLQIKQNRVILDLYDAGIWQKCILFYSFANTVGNGFSFYNWKNPSLYKITQSGSNTFTNNSGYRSASSSYLNTNYPINANAGLASDFSVVSHVPTSNTSSGSKSLYGVRTAYSLSDNSTLMLRPLVSGTTGNWFALRGAFDPKTFPSTNHQGMYHMRRISSAETIFKAAARTDDTEANLSALTYNSPLTLLGYNNYNVNGGVGGLNVSGFYDTANLSHFGLFTSLTDQQWTDYQQIWLTDHFNTL